jgi:UDP-glucuronate decarboxylase
MVTGGAGFVGSHLVDRLLDQGHHVLVVDNSLTGRWDFEDRRSYVETGQLSVMSWDIIDRFEPTLRDVIGRYDQIYNLACPASPERYQADPIHTWKTSVMGAANMLDLADHWGARILQASTSEIYGDPYVHPQRETYWGNVNPIGPRSCYDEGKRAAETIFYDYARYQGTDIRVARIFNTYGPRMSPDDGRVVSNFIVQALRGQPLTVYGNGMQTRSFCYVDDLVRGLMALMNVDNEGDEPLLPVNLGNPCEFTIMDLARQVNERVGNGDVILKPLPVDDPQQRRPDISRAKELLTWEPHIELAQGLEPTIEYFRKIV